MITFKIGEQTVVVRDVDDTLIIGSEGGSKLIFTFTARDKDDWEKSGITIILNLDNTDVT